MDREILVLSLLALLLKVSNYVKKFFLIALVLGIYLNWGSIQGGSSRVPYSAQANAEVVLYATEWCGYCQKTRELLADNNIPYVEYDIEESEQGYREYKNLGGRGVPVVNVKGTVIHGYSAQRILAAARSE